MPTTPHPRNAIGDFYVQFDCCTLCGVPWDIAPDLFSYDDSGCWVARQPATPLEESKMVQVFATQDLNCIRYRGTQLTILQALRAVGERRQCDYPIEEAEQPRPPTAPNGRSLFVRFMSWLRGPRQ